MRLATLASLLPLFLACSSGDEGSAAAAGASGAGGSGGAAGAAAGSSGASGSSGAAAGTTSAGGAAGSTAAGAGGGAGTGGAAPTCGVCAPVPDSETAVNVPYPALVELSGLAASHQHQGVVYAHNDSGDTARYFAFTLAGEAKGELRLDGAPADDIEDVALGPCAAGTCVYLADIGDNAEARKEYAVLVTPEPATLGNTAPASVPFQRLRFQYPDGSHNAETFLVQPKTGDAYVVTKVSSGKSAVYKLAAPHDFTKLVTAQKIADLPIPSGGSPLATGGDVHPCGDRFLLRTYSGLFEYRAPAGQPFEAAFGATAVPMTAAGTLSEPQSESVAYLPDGKGYVTGSENPVGKTPLALHRYTCP